MLQERYLWLNIQWHQWLSQQQETRPHVSCFLLGCCDHSTHSSQMERVLKEDQKKWQKSQRGWIKAQKCIVTVCLQLAVNMCVDSWILCSTRTKHGSLGFFCNSFVCLEWVQQEARGDFSLAIWELMQPTWNYVTQHQPVHYLPFIGNPVWLSCGWTTTRSGTFISCQPSYFSLHDLHM